MRLITYRLDGTEHLGAVVDGEVHDLTSALGARDVRALLAGPGLRAAQEALPTAPRVAPVEQLELAPVVPRPRKIICVGANYDLHRQEMGREALPYPTLFTRFPDSMVGHRQPLLRPWCSERFDYEGELAVIIGAPARHVPAARAYEVVAGYTCFNDGSVRDFQRHTTQFTPGKNFDASGGMGPWMVTADELPDPHALELRTRLNGELMQSANTGQMSFRIPELIAYITTFTTLAPGDVIATGTPSGVGDKRSPPRYMRAGDVVEVELSGIGVLTHPVADESRPR
jgi:2-keto-4-pentenoate hydratase/2-oxohepta-3-ene-1,7-dioic acid hydratase in catechol pathway